MVLVADFRYLRWFWSRVFIRPAPRGLPQPWLLRTVQLMFCGLIAWFLLGSMISPVILMWGFPLGPVSLASFVILFVLPSLYKLCTRAGVWFDGLNKWYQTAGVVLVLGCFFTVEFLIGSAVRVIPDWDAGTIFGNAAGLATGSTQTIDPDYYSMYPNNIMLTLVLAGYLSVLHQFGVTDLYLAAIALNAVVMTAAVLLVVVVARKIAGIGMAIFALLPCAVYIALSPWIAVPYSDTLGMIFPILLLYLFQLGQETSKRLLRYGLWFAMGLVAAIGFYVKPTIVLVLIAAAVAVVFARRAPLRNWRLLGGSAICLILTFGAFAAGSAAIKASVAASHAVSFDLNNNDREFPVTHFLKMGSAGLGGFNGPDVTETKSIASAQDRFQNGIDVYVDRVSTMGPWGYLDFLNVKGKAILGDGTFFNWGEGMARKPVELVADDSVSRALQDYFYYDGPHFAFTRAFWQSFWFVTLLLVAAPLLLRGRSMLQPAAIVMRLSLLALVMFLLLFEGRSRYLYMYLPFFLLLASLTVATLA
ncbi:glycosyltransferase family 39 protein, partial [Arthrobacter sp. 2YAF22_2]